MRTNRPSPLPATLGVALAVFGGTAAVMMRSGPLDPRVALAGLVAAAGLTVALAAMIWARHRTETTLLRARQDRLEDPDGPGAVVVVPLGHGQAAVIFDEPVPPAGPAPDPATRRRNAHRNAHRDAEAIWAAVEATVAAEASSPDSSPDAPPAAPRRRGQGNPPGPAGETR